MKILAIGDMHIKANHRNEVDLMSQQLDLIVTEHNPDIITILGDMHDSFGVIKVNALNLIIRFFNNIMKHNKPVYYIIGNHDYQNNQCYNEETHAFNAFKNWHENLTIIDKPQKLNNILMLPYVPVGRFQEAIDIVGMDGIDLIFCHQEFKGCKLGAIVSEHGDVWPETNPIVISGHIHERGVLGKNILYVGSPYQTSFGDPSKKSIELITITDKVSTKPIYLTMPQKITINVAASKFALHEFDLDPANYYRVNIEGDSETLHAIKKSKKYKELCETAKVVTKPSDKITVQRSFGRSFSQILADSIKDEDKEMQVLHEEVIRDAN